MKKITFLIFSILTCYAFKSNVAPYTYADNAPITYYNASGITIRGKQIEGGRKACILLYNCHDIRITNCYLKSSDTYGINVQNCYNISIDSNFVTNCQVVGIQAIGCTGNIRIISNQISEIYSKNLIHDGSGNALEFYKCNGANNAIDSNIIEHTSTATIDGLGNGAGDNIDVFQCNGTPSSRIKIYWNKVRGGGSYSLGNGRAGIGLGDVGGSYQDAEYNTCVNTGWAGMQLAGGTHITVNHNKIYSDQLAWSYAGLTSFIAAPGGVTTHSDTMAYNAIHWGNGYNLHTELDTFYSNKYGNPLPYGFRTLNTFKAPITSDILPKKILTYVSGNLIPTKRKAGSQ